jgi:microcystin-dependent protein
VASPFLGEVRPFAFSYAPVGWAFCNGQLLSISQNTALFSLLGTNFGGDGRSTFGLPDLRGRVPIHTDRYSDGTQYPIGIPGGVETVTLSLTELPGHSHTFVGTNAAANEKRPVAGSAYATSAAAGNVSPDQDYYGPPTTLQSINPGTLGAAGSGQSHTNLQPFLVINWCIALQGVFPSRS